MLPLALLTLSIVLALLALIIIRQNPRPEVRDEQLWTIRYDFGGAIGVAFVAILLDLLILFVLPPIEPKGMYVAYAAGGLSVVALGVSISRFRATRVPSFAPAHRIAPIDPQQAERSRIASLNVYEETSVLRKIGRYDIVIPIDSDPETGYKGMKNAFYVNLSDHLLYADGRRVRFHNVLAYHLEEENVIIRVQDRFNPTIRISCAGSTETASQVLDTLDSIRPKLSALDSNL